MPRLAACAAALTLSLSLPSCLAGPHQLRRSVDDWDQDLYVNSPLFDGVLWIVPVIPTMHVLALTLDFLITDAWYFWFDDLWDNKGTGFAHLKIDGKDGQLRSLLSENAAWMRLYVD